MSGFVRFLKQADCSVANWYLVQYLLRHAQFADPATVKERVSDFADYCQVPWQECQEVLRALQAPETPLGHRKRLLPEALKHFFDTLTLHVPAAHEKLAAGLLLLKQLELEGNERKQLARAAERCARRLKLDAGRVKRAVEAAVHLHGSRAAIERLALR